MSALGYIDEGSVHKMSDVGSDEVIYLVDGQDIEKLRRENAKLLTEIAELCDERDEDGVDNIFLLGLPGAGKSSLINTVHKAVAGKYSPRADVGSGLRKSKTLKLQRFQSCGVTRNNIIASQKEIVRTILPKLPTMFDAAGMEDLENHENPKAVEEILELYIGGFIPPDTSITVLEQLQRDYKIGCLSKIYTKSKPEYQITKVVFVQSCKAERVPVGLIRCLLRILEKNDPVTAQLMYHVSVFVVLTKRDLVKESDHPGKDYVSMEEFKKIEDCLAKEFSIEGALRDDMIHWTSYSDITVHDSPCIDNTALKFLKRMMIPRMPSENVMPVITPWKLWKLNAINKLNEKKKKCSCQLVVVCVLVAILLSLLLNAKPV